jgi:signal transduction histidine kinase/CheY-like chemotaxis protein/ligand-binding sensor domain-containing protein
MIIFRYIIPLFLLFFCSDLVAQSYSAKIRKLSIEDGLSNRFVQGAFQDSKGFIWLGTNYGLNRYDGYSFKLFTKEKEGLSSNVIHNIYEDGDTCLWITYLEKPEGKRLDRVDVLNLNTFKVQTIKSKLGADHPVEEKEIFEIYQGNKQSIFIVTKDKRIFEHTKGGSCIELFSLPYPTHTLNDILLTDNRIWLAGAGYLLEYNRDGMLLQAEKVPYKGILDMHWESGELSGYARSLSDSLFIFSKKGNKAIVSDLSPLFFEKIKSLAVASKIKQAPNGLIWYNDQVRAEMYSAKGELLYDFSTHLREKSIHTVTSVYFDNNNSAWVTTTNGVFVLTIQPNSFDSYLNESKYLPNSKAYSTRGIVEDGNGFLYVNSYSGRQKINTKTGEILSISHPGEPELDAMRDRAGNIWFCGESEYVECYDPIKNTIKNISCKSLYSKGNSNLRIMKFKLYQDSHDKIWMGTNDGVYYLDTFLNAFIKNNAYGPGVNLNTSEVYTFVEDTIEHILWVGGTTGVYKYDYDIGRFTWEYASTGTGAYYIPYNSILAIHKDAKDDCYWLGTRGGGLIKWIPKTGEYKHYTVATGLSDNVIYGILEDDDGYLWLSSNYGLMRFHKTKGWATTYLPKDGITNQEFNTLSYYKSASGRFYFGGINGINAFHPKDFRSEEETNIPMHILSYDYLKGDAEKLENRTQLLAQTKSIVLAAGDNFFRLTFSLLDFRDPSKNKYSYIIEGSGQGWQHTKENEIRINRLPYGAYTLRIRGEGFNGQESKNEIVIPIDVQVPFYKTWGFMLIGAFSCILITLIMAREAIRRSEKNKDYLKKEIANRTQKLLEREQDLLKAKEEAEKSSHAKAEFLSVMSHEIRTPMNAVVNLTNYLLEDNPSPEQIESLSILKFSANNLLAIINDVLDFNKIESGEVNIEYINFDLMELLESIKYGMSANAKKKGIYFFLNADLNLTNMLVGDPNRLVQVLNNLIGNAIKFTDKGSVKLILTVEAEINAEIKIKFEVKDTGIGIPQDKANYVFNMFTQAASDTTRKYGGTGLGLAITKRLLELQNSEIKLSSVVDKGSIFSFVLNFGKGTSLSAKPILGATKNQLKGDLRGVKILVVEDNAVNVLVVKKFLKKWGLEFTHAADGQAALDKVKEELFDLILMDIHMPIMDGYTATKAIRSMGIEHYEKTPIIALTASALMDNRNRIYEAGMNDIVVKPFNPQELYNMLVKHL